MTLKDKFIMSEYRDEKANYLCLEGEVVKILDYIVKTNDLKIYAINHRVKAENSLAGKLERKGDKYSSLSEITDILGVRLVTYFPDTVDDIINLLRMYFEIDEEQSIDKRKILDVHSFGYLAVHYICSLKDNNPATGKVYPEELKNKKFEIQICSLIQHVWAVLEHDLGYKTKFGIPDAVSRDFSRLAGLLEIADEHFVRIRDNVNAYTNEVHYRIENDTADEVHLDSVSINEYMRYSNNMKAYLEKFGKACNAEISQGGAESYIEQLAFLKITTIGALNRMLEEDGDFALQMAEKTLSESELDIISSSAALRFLCRAELIQKNYTESQAVDFFMISTKNKERSERYAKSLFNK